MSESQRLLTETISASVKGRPVEIDTDYTSSTDTTTLHTISVDNVADSVYLKVWNNHTSRHLITLVLNPNGNGSTAVVDAASVNFSLAPQAWTWLLEGERFRRIAGNPYTLAAYTTTAAGVTNKYLRVVGWYVRLTQEALTP